VDTLVGSVDQEDQGAGREDQGRVEDLREDSLEVSEEQIALDEDRESQELVEVEVLGQEPQKKEEAAGFLELRKLPSRRLTGLDMTGC